MIFGRRPERRPELLHYQRILVPLGGTEADETALRAAATLLAGSEGEANLLHVIEVPFDRQRDDEDAAERRADLILMGLRYKKRFGGQWDAGRTVPYVMRNSAAPVWCLRIETEDLAQTP